MPENTLLLQRVVTPGFSMGAPSSVVVQGQALFQILDHALRHNVEEQRVLGTLLGVRSEDGLEVEVRAAYAVPHEETQDQVMVDIDYHREMYILQKRANPKLVVLGWYSTTSELNNLSGLIHDFYSQSIGTYPFFAVHLTVQTFSVLDDIKVSTYISSPLGVSPDKSTGSCLFVSIPNEIRYSEIEQIALQSLVKAADSESRSVQVPNDIDALVDSLKQVSELLDRVDLYVTKVLKGEEPRPNNQVGRLLLKNLCLNLSLTPESLEAIFNSHVQDLLMVIYLANTVKTQAQLSAKLTPLVN